MAVDKRFEKLMEPGRIGSVKTRNRIIKTGAGMMMWHEDDTHMNEAMKAFYEGMARGGVGLLIVESPTIDYPLGARWRARYRIDDDKYIKGLSELVQVIRKHDCPTFMQMNHDGPWQRIIFEPTALSPGPPIAASPVSMSSDNDFHNEVPHELTIEEIEEIIDKFASAAVRAEKAGFQGVDINSASSHLGHNFLSPFWNRRQDKYGGSLENRARFMVEIIQEIKKRLGQDFPVSVCINGMEIGRIVGVDNEKCMTPEYSRGIARVLQEAGADNIHVRSHWLGRHVAAYLPELFCYPECPVPLKDFPKEYDRSRRGAGANILLSEGIKKAVSIPVMVVGRLDPVLGEEVLQKGMADFIGMTRRLIADPDFPNKVAAGKLDDIAPCTACDNCLGSGRCRINANLGTEYNTYEKAEKKKNVVVVGGGPAGLAAARVAALRGHDVALYEKSSKLGGLLSMAAMVKGTEIEDLPAFVRYFERQITELGVKINLGREVAPSTIEELKPDAVILATGGMAVIPGIPGIYGRNVVNGAVLHQRLKMFLKFFAPQTLRWLTHFYLPVGKRVIVIGGGIQGCEVAEFFTKRGRKVTIVEKADRLGEGMVDVHLGYLLTWFKEKGVTTISGVKEYVEITAKGLTIVTKEGERQTIEANTIVTAIPLMKNTELLEKLEGKVPELYTVGDCKEPLLIADAVGDGSRTARAI